MTGQGRTGQDMVMVRFPSIILTLTQYSTIQYSTVQHRTGQYRMDLDLDLEI